MLTVAMVKATNKPGQYPDRGGARGLHLYVAPGGSKSWTFRFQLRGRRTWLGLGSIDDVTLAEARDAAIDARRLVKQGINPIDQKRGVKTEAVAAAAKRKSFMQCADEYIALKRHEWTDPSNEQKWRNTLRDYVAPIFGDLPVDRVETPHVIGALQPIWLTKTETASRVRQRVESVLDFAKTGGLRSGENPAAWNGHLENHFPKPSKVAPRVHLKALPYKQLAAFMRELGSVRGIAARAFEFAILTGGRTQETLKAQWSEIDMAERVWNIPAPRMKARRDHRVPLSDAAMAILESMAAIRTSDFVFPGAKPGRPLAHSALRETRNGMGYKDELTPHGMRSAFRDWGGEQTAYPREVLEAALAHTVRNATETAYARGDLFEKRCRLMAEWAEFCAMPAAAEGDENVVPMRRA